nr:MAG: nucleoside triphosphate pyrophosphohydrolase-like protein [Enquatrovirus sp.]
MRFFVLFRANTSLHNKVMVFTNIQRRHVWEYMVSNYKECFHTILTEPEMANQFPLLYSHTDNWIKQGTECIEYTPTGTISYPLKLTDYVEIPHKVSLASITDWFKAALPEPTEKDRSVQAGVHLEEFAEMLEAMGHQEYASQIHELAMKYKNQELVLTLDKDAEIAYLDALGDQVVTATANAYVRGYKWDEALTEINQSNFSKFEDGKPVFNEQGKIAKGKDYFKPDLEQYVNP